MRFGVVPWEHGSGVAGGSGGSAVCSINRGGVESLNQVSLFGGCLRAKLFRKEVLLYNANCLATKRGENDAEANKKRQGVTQLLVVVCVCVRGRNCGRFETATNRVTQTEKTGTKDRRAQGIAPEWTGRVEVWWERTKV